ncbi:hypothetical protein ACRALDRAFT_2021550 [Sodiomyces alcalophilus JCM 7366]|uniref:uncharacterized protein n=1 Tax=Sodiomyces alcalophilus JCM 7366 TaxID=591952 RepID=UPI0039B538E9
MYFVLFESQRTSHHKYLDTPSIYTPRYPCYYKPVESNGVRINADGLNLPKLAEWRYICFDDSHIL